MKNFLLIIFVIGLIFGFELSAKATTNEYTGEIDRRVWISGQAAPDNPADKTMVLVAKAKPMTVPEKPVIKVESKPKLKPKPQIIYVKSVEPEDDVIVKTSWCDPEKEICE